MTVDFNKLQKFPAYKNVPLTESELLTNSITGETWALTEAYYHRMAEVDPMARIVQIDGKVLSYAEAAGEVAKKTGEGAGIVRAHKSLIKYIRKVLEEEENAE